jgi:polysaccharide pyruvyl transferase WcaK-like protein
MTRQTITFLGNFGTHNLGNECTLQAILQNVRKYSPEAKVNCICTDPDDTAARHGIPAVPMSHRFGRASKSTPPRPHPPLLRLIRRLFIRIPLELLEWLRAFRTLASTTMLIMTGTGMLGDFGIGPFDLHYEILKWSMVAKLRRSKVLFVSVGAGPLDHPISRWLVKLALSMADYRSYRDMFSKQYLASIGFNTSGDRVYPDLVFSFLRAKMPIPPPQPGTRRIIGLGLMEYYGNRSSPEHGRHIYQRYLQALTHFAAWLLERKYSVRLLIGDLTYDKRVCGDVLRILEENGVKCEPGRIISASVASVQDLWTQLAETDMVVATRFHNILLALMLNKPVLALSYHDKVRSLMAAAGLSEYCQDIAALDGTRLREQFSTLEGNAELVRFSLQQKNEDYRRALDEQYRHIFSDL